MRRQWRSRTYWHMVSRRKGRGGDRPIKSAKKKKLRRLLTRNYIYRGVMKDRRWIASIAPLKCLNFLCGYLCLAVPSKISQSTFNGRNGIDTCSLIFLLVAYIFFRNGIKIPDLGPLPHDIFRMLCACIELGNRGNDICRDSLPNRSLSVQEAATLLSFTNISTRWPRTVHSMCLAK